MLKTSVESNIYALQTNEPDDNIISHLQSTLDIEYLNEKVSIFTAKIKFKIGNNNIE